METKVSAVENRDKRDGKGWFEKRERYTENSVERKLVSYASCKEK